MLCYQSHTLGLFPRGKTQHARVRDNVYCAATLWCLSMAYRHVGYDRGRTYELEQSAVKCMRGLLFCYMRQAEKVEKFKSTQNWEDALHAKFDYMTGDPVTNDDSWGHLQVRRDGGLEVTRQERLCQKEEVGGVPLRLRPIDGTSLFLQILAQMTATGVQVVFTLDEVDFVQNLVYYVERAYRIPDFGMWERGSRDNIGKRELHSSSIGMAKAALEAMNGLNLFGESGSSLSVIHVDPDAQYRNCVILNTLLPKESNSKEVDAALLLITGYPAFAIDDVNLSKTTEQRVKKLLEGQSGFKRFTRDGHYTIKEDKRKTFYDSHEVAQFEGIECEYPLFYGYLVLTELCRGHRDKAESYWKKLEACTVEMNGVLYYVPEEELVADETGTLVSMATSRDYNYKLVPFSETVPFLWAQAIYLIARMLSECIEGCGEGVIVEGSVLREDNLIDVSDCDPLGLHLPHTARHRGMARHLGFRAPGHDTVIQVALISETTRVCCVFSHGCAVVFLSWVGCNGYRLFLLPTGFQPKHRSKWNQSRSDHRLDILMKVFSHIGENRKLGLSGRPNRPIGALATSKVYRVFGHTMIFYPTDSMVDFYLSFDGTFLIDVLKGPGFYSFVNFLSLLKQGEVNGIRVRLDRLQALISHLMCGESRVLSTGQLTGAENFYNASALGEEEVKEKEQHLQSCSGVCMGGGGAWRGGALGVEVELRGMEVELVEVELGGVEVEFVWVEVELGGWSLEGWKWSLEDGGGACRGGAWRGGGGACIGGVCMGGGGAWRGGAWRGGGGGGGGAWMGLLSSCRISGDYSVRELQSALKKEENLLGQAYLLYELMKKVGDDTFAMSPAFCPRHKIAVMRKTLTELTHDASLGTSRELMVLGTEIAVVYYRAGYTPQDYPSEKEWDVRLLMERSKATVSPCASYHLVGTKKVQQALAAPGVLERKGQDQSSCGKGAGPIILGEGRMGSGEEDRMGWFLVDPEAIQRVRSTFAGLFGLDMVCANATLYLCTGV
eukprot:Em0018g92a